MDQDRLVTDVKFSGLVPGRLADVDTERGADDRQRFLAFLNRAQKATPRAAAERALSRCCAIRQRCR